MFIFNLKNRQRAAARSKTRSPVASKISTQKSSASPESNQRIKAIEKNSPNNDSKNSKASFRAPQSESNSNDIIIKQISFKFKFFSYFIAKF